MFTFDCAAALERFCRGAVNLKTSIPMLTGQDLEGSFVQSVSVVVATLEVVRSCEAIATRLHRALLNGRAKVQPIDGAYSNGYRWIMAPETCAAITVELPMEDIDHVLPLLKEAGPGQLDVSDVNRRIEDAYFTLVFQLDPQATT